MVVNSSNTEQYLRNAGIKPSIQRIEIFDYLVNTKSHPTVETIYKSLLPGVPTLSKMTVYNTIRLFQKHGLVMAVNIEDNETRYDADVSFHGHFKCTVCGIVSDFTVNRDDLNIELLKEYEINESHFYMKGKCINCK